MNGNTRLKGFKDDTWINGIGDLFCKKGGVRWGVNLSIYPSKESGPDVISLSNAPILVLKNIINLTKDYYRKGYELAFTITTSRHWEVDTLNNCPVLERRLSKILQQYCFVFHLTDGAKIFLPQFELARALFFHNGYLARSSLVHDVLNNEFAVEYGEGDGKGIINVLDICNCPAELFNDCGYRRVLAWLLMDRDARQSYDSISNNQLVNGRDAGEYRAWTFQFDPPALEGVMLKVKGRFDSKSRIMLVYEITSIRNIPANLPEHIEFFSPKFYTQVNGQGLRPASGAVRPSGHRVDEDAEGSRENKPFMISENTTEFEFNRAIVTSKISKKRKATGGGRNGDGEPGESPCDVSTEEQGPNGDLPSAEWDNLDEQTDDAHLYENKFIRYFEMLKLLKEKHGNKVLKYPLRKLPALGKSKRHILRNDGNPRCLSVAYVTVRGTGYYLLEVDTSDTKKALSTKVIVASVIGDIRKYVCEIENRLLKDSLSWPKEFLDKLVGKENHFWIPHQKSTESGALTPTEITKWAYRMNCRLLN